MLTKLYDVRIATSWIDVQVEVTEDEIRDWIGDWGLDDAGIDLDTVVLDIVKDKVRDVKGDILDVEGVEGVKWTGTTWPNIYSEDDFPGLESEVQHEVE